MQLFLLIGLILLNGIFAMSETALISARHARLQQRAKAGDDRAVVALALVAQPSRFLSTVQIGITLIGVLSGTLGETSLGQPLAHFFQYLGLSRGISDSLGLILGIVIITYFSLVLGELVPKTLALANAENLSLRVAGAMSLLAKAATPLVWLLTISTDGLLRLIGFKASKEPPVTQDEVKNLIAQGTKIGVFDEGEQEIIERLFRAADRRISSVMTPRREISFLDIEDTWEINSAKIASTPHTAFPVCIGGLDGLVGIIPLKALWWASEQRAAVVDLRTLSQEPLYLMEHRLALEALEEFRSSSRSMGLVVDEYGNTVGLLTLHDLLEALVGEMGTDGAKKQDHSAVKREDGSWLLDGMLPVDEFVHALGIQDVPDDSRDYATLGGFVMSRMEHIPMPGDQFTWSRHRFEVLDMDGHRVDKVLVMPLPTSATS